MPLEQGSPTTTGWEDERRDAVAPVLRRSLLPAAELRAMSTRSGVRATLAITRQWVIIGVTVLVVSRVGAWWAYAPGAVVIATRQHGLATLMHDGAHHLLYRNRKLNDVVSDIFLAFPLFVSTRLYRRHHLVHHRQLNTTADPDLDVVSVLRTPRDWAMITIGDLTGINLVKVVGTAGEFSVLALIGRGARDTRAWLGRAQIAGFGVFVASLVTVLVITGTWWLYLMLWLVPSLTVLNFIFRVRSIAEHVACTNSDELDASRTVLANVLELWLFAPCNINYHLEHHLFPGVPHYNLRRLRRQLASDPEYQRRGTTCTSYVFGSDSVLASVLQAGA